MGTSPDSWPESRRGSALAASSRRRARRAGTRGRRLSACLSLGLALALPLPGWAADCRDTPQRPFCLAQAGNLDAARAGYERTFRALANEGESRRLWSSLMAAAWEVEGLGEPLVALDYSNRALEIALQDGDAYRLGRSLAWLGWSYTSLGRYELALEFFDRAIEVGAPRGRVEHVGVWGIALQEKGWVLARMGRLAEGKRLLVETTDYARAHGICPGLAEGSPHVAHIALLQGDLAEARRYADEGLDASRTCGGGTTRARALVASAKVDWLRSLTDPKLAERARGRAEEALAYAEQIGDKRQIAAALLLQADALPAKQSRRRIELAERALGLLTETGSELTSAANAGLGRVLAADDQRQLAAFYARIGLEIAEDRFQEVDAAYILGDLADLDLSEGDETRELAKREEAATRAEQAGAWPRAVEEMEVLADAYERRGFALLSARWAHRAVVLVDRLLAMDLEPAVEADWLERKAVLTRRLAEVHFTIEELAPERPPL